MAHFIRINTLFVVILFFSNVAYSQIPNPGFENWTSQGFPAYLNPAGWGTLNGATSLAFVYTCERASGADAFNGSYAMKLTSKSVFGQSAPGIAVTGTINTGTQELEGGFPFTLRPTHLTGWYKYAPASGDNCEINVTLWSRSPQYEEIGNGVIQPTAAVATFTRFLVPISYTSANTPDSGRVLLVSTNTSNIKVGSELIIDDLQFIDCSTLSDSISSTDVSFVGNTDGTATATASGGAGSYTYLWNNNSTTAGITGLSAGYYCVTITDANGCTVSGCATVNEPDCTGFIVDVSANSTSANGGSDGSAIAIASGGTPPYSYSWDNLSISDSIGSLSAGIYCITVTDSVGCTTTDCGTVNDPICSGFTLTIDSVDVTTVAGADGVATANPAGGTAPYSYSWNTDDTVQTISNLVAGNYCVTVSDSNNCLVFGCVRVNEPDCSGFNLVLLKVDVTTVGGTNGAVTANPSGTAPFSYLWNTIANAHEITGLTAGSYCVTVTDQVLCRDSQCVDVLEPSCTGFGVSVAVTDESTAGMNDGSAVATANGGASPITYQWDVGSTGSGLSNLPPGEYCVTATDTIGCTATACDSVKAGAVGILSASSGNGINIYPNPVYDYMIIELDEDQETMLVIYDFNGKRLVEKLINQSVVKIAVTFAPGEYIYSITQLSSKQVRFGKILVMN